MATAFAFDSAPLDILGSGTYCVFPVSAIPSQGASLSGDVSSVPGFTPIVLTGRNLLPTGLIFNDFSYPFFTYSVSTVGFCLSRLVGGTPSPSDRLVSFSAYSNALTQDIITPPGSFANSFTVDTIKGLLELVPVYRYTSTSLGVPAPGAFPLGLMYLAGTRNATVSYANPISATRMAAWRATDGGSLAAIYDRTGGNDGLTDHILDMRMNRIRVGQFLVRANSGSAVPNAQWFGSNLIEELSITAGNTAAIFADNSLWTPLTSVTTLPSSIWSSMQSTNNQTFFKFLKFSTGNTVNNAIVTVEFGESTYESTTINMVP